MAGLRTVSYGIALLLSGLVAPCAYADGVTVLTAAQIDTMDVAAPRASAMAFDDSGKILALGDDKTLLARYPDAKRLDVGDAAVIPGMIDAH